MIPYATRLRIHLAASRRAGLPWEGAWSKALRELVRETDYPLHDRDVKRAYREGYLRTGGMHAGISALAEPYEAMDGPAYIAPDAPRKHCGWGGEGGCTRVGAPWLCAEHSAILQPVAEAMKSAAQRDLKRGGISSWSHHERVECVTPGCKRYASRGAMHCARHGVKVAA